MRDDHRSVFGRAELRHTRGDDAQCIDVQPRIGLVENGQLRREHRHLKDLVLLLLAARKTFVHRARHQLRIELHDGALLLHQAQELRGRKSLFTTIFTLFLNGHLHKIGHRHAGNLDRILEAEEQPQPRPILDRHRQQVVPLKSRRSCRHGELLVSGQHRRQRALARTVGPHDRMYLAGLHVEVDAPQDLLVVDRSV